MGVYLAENCIVLIIWPDKLSYRSSRMGNNMLDESRVLCREMGEASHCEEINWMWYRMDREIMDAIDEEDEDGKES